MYDKLLLGGGRRRQLSRRDGAESASPGRPQPRQKDREGGRSLGRSVSSESSELAQGPESEGEGGTLTLDRRAARPRGSRPEGPRLSGVPRQPSGDGPQAALLGSPLRSALGSSDPRPAHCSWGHRSRRVFKPREEASRILAQTQDRGVGREWEEVSPVPQTSACHRPGTPVSRHSSAVAQDEVEGRRPEHRRGFQLSSVPRHPPTAPTSRLGDWGRAAPNKHVTCLEQPGRLGPDLHSALFGVSGKQETGLPKLGWRSRFGSFCYTQLPSQVRWMERSRNKIGKQSMQALEDMDHT
ncbi:hypothetical protein ABFV05_013024 [Capra hircus]